jgi:alpha-beta hydrolase superfamily lysophospholipase
VLALVHGMGEHSSRYPRLVSGLTARGFGVYGFDHRGHGRSDGRRGHVEAWSDYLNDVGAFLLLVHQQQPAVPVFLYGHSMGSQIVLPYLAERGAQGLAGAVISGTAAQVNTASQGHLVLLARVLAVVLPRLAIGVPAEWEKLSRDPQAIAANQADRLLLTAFTARWGTEFLAAPARVRAAAARINLPVLFQHGGADPLVPVAGALAFYEQVPSADKRLIVYPGALHEPHNDLCADQVASDVADWLTAHLPA